jgi:hypothetical protein
MKFENSKKQTIKLKFKGMLIGIGLSISAIGLLINLSVIISPLICSVLGLLIVTSTLFMEEK